MSYIIYKKKTGHIEKVVDYPSFLKNTIEVLEDEDIIYSDIIINKIHKVENGLIVEKEVNNSIENDRSLVWDSIKNKRLSQISEGVLVKSVDKVFHTDSDSLTQYSNIAGMIALDNYIPVEWKTLDNTYILLTVDLFKELQKAIQTNTQETYKIAEQHKEIMLTLDNPIDYDFSKNWLNGIVDY